MKSSSNCKPVSFLLRRSRALFLVLLSFTTVVHGKSTLSPSELLSDLSVDKDSTSSVSSKQGDGPLDEVNSQEALIMTNIEIKCATHEIRIKIPTPHPDFSGMVYPQVSVQRRSHVYKKIICKTYNQKNQSVM